MYTSFFGLNEKPFSITPDPRYLFMSERHGEALAHLVYGVTESGGFMQLTGEVGTGKTTLVRTLLQSRMPDNANVAVVLNPQLSVHEFLVTICEELHIDVSDAKYSIKALTDGLNLHLLRAHGEGRHTILVVDEAQNLTPSVLEQVRLLTNLETAKQKLLQIILIGQPELRELLARNDLRQLAQRITARYHLEPLSRDETVKYIEHRLRVAGALGEIFDTGAKREVFRLSQGVPRLVNVICDRALLGAYSQESRHVNRRLVRRAASEVSGQLERSSMLRGIAVAAGVVGVAIIVASFWLLPRVQAPGLAGTVIEALPIAEAKIAKANIAEANIPKSDTQDGGAIETAESDAESSLEADPPSLTQQLLLASELTSSQFAYATLFDLWGLEYKSGTQDGCAQAAAQGLSCFYHRGSWNGLRQLDRPAILRVINTDGRAHEIVVTAIRNDQVDVSLGGVSVTHPVAAITELWFGQYMLLWRPPSGAPVALTPGSSGADVAWLRESLGSIDDRYRVDGSSTDIYDSETEQIVRTFQRDHRLAVDGVAGQQTQIVINSLLAADGTPRLSMSRPATSQLAKE